MNTVPMRRIAYLGICLALLASAAAPFVRGQDLTVDCAKKFQVVHGFGTCLSNWQPSVVAAIQDPKVQKMYVEDLGASLIRIPLEGRVCDEVANVDDIKWQNFNWKRQNDRTPMDAIAAIYKLDPKHIRVIASEWTPPHWMKEGDDLKYGDESCGGHLRADKRAFFAKYLAEYVLGIKEKYGIPIYAVSLQNELVFNEPYMSCTYDPGGYRDTLIAVGDAFKAAKLDTKQFGPEDMTLFPDRFMQFVDSVMNDPRAKDYLSFIGSHGYSDGIHSEGSSASNDALWNRVKPYKRELWMTETSGESPDWNGALQLAGKIHNGLVAGNISGWTYWQLTDSSSSAMDLMGLDKPNKKFYASKQYFRYIRPEARRVDVSGGNNDLLVSAFEHPADHTLTVVLINRGHSSASAKLTVKGFAVESFEQHRTSDRDDCVDADKVSLDGGKAHLDVPGQSIVTLYGK